MLVAQRHQKIVELVNERSSIRVTELSEIFSVTEETIRRDLEKLEKETKLKQTKLSRNHVNQALLMARQQSRRTHLLVGTLQAPLRQR